MADPEQVTRDKAHALRAEHMEKMQKEHPADDLKLGSRWWVPATDFSFDLREKLDRPTYEKVNAIFARFYAQELEPDAAAQAMQDARECLRDHPDLVESFDAIFKSMGPKLLAAVRLMKQRSGTCGTSGEPSGQGEAAGP